MSSTNFQSRHIGPDTAETTKMLRQIGSPSLEALISDTVPASIRLAKALALQEGMSEHEFLEQLKEISLKNVMHKNYIGLGYYNTYTPNVILRNIFENPGWYTAYTPYQAEIAQGRLEALLNFQTMCSDLTGMEISNASLLDEATAAAEAMLMFYHVSDKDFKVSNRFFVSEECFPQTIAVLKTRSEPLGIVLEIGDHRKVKIGNEFFGALLQYPSRDGEVYDYTAFVKNAQAHSVQIGVAADLLSLVMLKPPGEWGADAVVGSTQRFGIPMGFGGPHAAYFSVKEKYKRNIPGRIIGVSQDMHGNPALRMALQTREQHIRRDKATSNICTSQVLLAVMAGMYAVYHGPAGLKKIAARVNAAATALSEALAGSGFQNVNQVYFDTLKINTGNKTAAIRAKALAAKINFRYVDDTYICITIDETSSATDLARIAGLFKETSEGAKSVAHHANPLPERTSAILTHPVFNQYHSETEMLRYLKRLENKDLSLAHSMIPLGSCTMKLNATAEMIPLSWSHFSQMHPFVPADQAAGYMQIITELEKMLCTVTGFAGVSLQPNSGAQGEYAGLMVIRAYHIDKGQAHRNVVLIPSSAHGTNPATAVMAGMKVVVVKCDDQGNIDVKDMEEKALQYKNELCALMVTYPSTHGVFEEKIREITKLIHDQGGLVYMDGANMNAQVGLTNPASIGADVCHLNLHKTFAIPHGGGGPGMGPIGVTAQLAPFLPSHPVVKTGGEKGIPAVSAGPWGSASILLITYAYIKMLGAAGVTRSTEYAILNANYIKSRLEKYYPVLYTGTKKTVAHEMILDCRQLKMQSGVEVEDIAKRLMDYGYHAPTVSFPVAGTLMIEPTESESKAELDRFCEAMIAIRKEIQEIIDGKADRADNVLKNAPHTVAQVTSDAWKHPYSREKAAYPLHWVSENKFWPGVSRIDNAYGDRNLVCVCPPIEAYSEELVS